MRPPERGIESFVVSGEAAEACRPGEAAFDDPAFRQQHEASFCHRVLDDFELDTVCERGFGSIRSRVALVDIGELDRVSGHLLDLFGESCDLAAVALVGRRDGERTRASRRRKPCTVAYCISLS